MDTERGLFGLKAVGNEACDQIDQEIDGAAMARMFDLRDVFELNSDGLDDGAFAQEQLVRVIEQTVVHLFTQFGDELLPLGFDTRLFLTIAPKR